MDLREPLPVTGGDAVPTITDAAASRANLVALRTIARREVARILRIWAQTLVPPAITMTLYFLIFGSLIGARIGQMGGFSYMDFEMMSVIERHGSIPPASSAPSSAAMKSCWCRRCRTG
jgi:hypothetical protein